MAGLQRSSETFRRSGSSGMVWEETQKPASGKEKPAARNSAGHAGYRTEQVQPTFDPPSPRVDGCGICGLFGKDKQAPQSRAGGKAKGKRR